jgi:hypothetical protein
VRKIPRRLVLLSDSSAARKNARACGGFPLPTANATGRSPDASHALGSFHTSERRGGVERRQLKLKGVESGD